MAHRKHPTNISHLLSIMPLLLFQDSPSLTWEWCGNGVGWCGNSLFHPRSTYLSLHCVCAQSLQSCPTLCNSMHCSPGSSVHGIFQESILQWVAISSFRESSQPRNWIHICFVRWILYHCTTCDLQGCANKSLTTSSLKKLSFAAIWK